LSIENPVVAIVDDNIIDAELISTILTRDNIRNWVSYSAESFFREALNREFHVLVIDICLPGENGISCIKHLSQRTDIGCIVVSGGNDENAYRNAIEAGAEMFLSKPLRRQDLLAAVNVTLKRLNAKQPGAKPQLVFNLNISNQTLTLSDGTPVQLTAAETQLLMTLSSRAGEIVDKQAIAEKLQLTHLLDPGHRVEVILSRLRKKLARNGIESPVRSVFGQGKVCDIKLNLTK
jgi:DNA-binding response OmpR family regulator